MRKIIATFEDDDTLSLETEGNWPSMDLAAAVSVILLEVAERIAMKEGTSEKDVIRGVSCASLDACHQKELEALVNKKRRRRIRFFD